MTQSRAWVNCDVWDEPHWEGEYCENPVPVPAKKVDSVLGCVIDEMPASRPGQGERYH